MTARPQRDKVEDVIEAANSVVDIFMSDQLDKTVPPYFRSRLEVLRNALIRAKRRAP